MKPFERRSFLKAIGCAAGALPGTSALCSPSVGRHHKRRVSQGELETAIELHAYWMTNDPRGKRAAFSNCDLSGRDFMTDRTEIINLHGADFTEADLIFVTGNEVNFRHASPATLAPLLVPFQTTVLLGRKPTRRRMQQCCLGLAISVFFPTATQDR